MDFKIKPIPDGHKRGWTITIDGEVACPSHIELHNPNIGTLTFGLRPEGYDGWVFETAGPERGGVLTIPYTYWHGELFVGLIEEGRPNMGGKVLCAIGGIVDPGETPDEAERREAEEEACLGSFGTPFKLPGVGINSDRLFFLTDTAGQKEGTRAYGLMVPTELLEQANRGSSCLKIKQGETISRKDEDSVYFYPWREAVLRTGDGLGRAGIAQLLAEIL